MIRREPDDGGGVPPPGRDGRAGEGARAIATDETTGLPGLRTWRGVYVFVLGCFVAYVVLLTVFGRYFA